MEKQSVIKRFKHYIRASKAEEIARRYFISNAFDGALTVLGIVIGAYIVGVKNPSIVIGACLGASIAMGFSGFFGVYMAEKAERTKQLKDLENALFTNLRNSFLDRALKVTAVWVAFAGGISPALVIVVSITPFFLVSLGFITFENAFYCFVGLVLLILFILGAFLGKISKESIVLQGLKMMTVGIILTLLFLIFHVSA